MIWEDADRDGKYDKDERPLQGVRVELWAQGALRGSDPLAVHVTDADGTYSFGSMPAGEYCLSHEPPPGYMCQQETWCGTVTGVTQVDWAYQPLHKVVLPSILN
jgi:hypothetical protein